MDDTPQWRVEMAARECLRLLGSVTIGRLVFTTRALPAIRPACHLIDGKYVIIGTDAGSLVFASSRPGGGPVLAYEADVIDPLSCLGWSVVVVGSARRVTDPGRVAAYQQALAPWIAGADDQVIEIPTDVITGFRLLAGEAAGDEIPVPPHGIMPVP
jgi:hypothetical protein